MNRMLPALFLSMLAATAAGPVRAAAGARPSAASDMGGNPWVAGWYAAPYAPFAYSGGATPAVFANQTVRHVIRVDASGTAIRLRFANEFGLAPLRVAGVHVALAGADGQPASGSDRTVLFGGQPEAFVPAGSPLLSDAIEMPVQALQRLVVSVYYREAAMPGGHHAMLQVAPGEQLAAGALAQAQSLRGPSIVSEVDVRRGATRAPVVMAFGDSITEGAASTPGADLSWPQQLAKRLQADPARRDWIVLNAGISGNRLLREGFSVPALGRFDRDALAVPGVTHVVLLEGINDIGWWDKPDSEVTAEAVIGAYRQLVERAHARGLKVIGGTLLPYRGAVYFSEQGERMRQAVNEFIRHGRLFDGVIDFEAATRDAADPTRIDPKLEPGDHLHPNDAGYAAMADAVPVSLFEPAR